ncbi:M48 family metalloprotease [Bartonella sp. 220]|uniref:M48 family metalloprotease n=1 Tax=Bartonella sp. 220B TaxID=2967260 RepID=UPI0022A9F235|nr:M48 family metalloprotease [Bartonella sp. 220B]MCZ2157958.1 M48 family metalloprotease [Bartonella sp. 220B]
MNVVTIHAENKRQKSQRHQIFRHSILQRAFSFRSKMYKATLLSFMLLLSACHTHLSKNDTLSSLDSSETIKRTSNNNIYVTLSTIQHPRILQLYGGAYYDAKLDRLLAKIVRKLTAVSHNSQQNYSVTILNSESVNAFALPGGFIYITRGMLALANDSSEVAAILAHEIAHITAKHGILRLQKAAELKKANHTSPRLFSHVEKKTPIENQQQIAQFSRNQELQADSLALDMLKQAGYDPFASPRFLQTMEAYRVFRNTAGARNASLDFLATHPSTPQRIRLATEKARKISTVSTSNTDGASFLMGNRKRDSFLESLDGMIFGGSFHTGFVRGNQFIHPQLRITFSVPNNFIIENSVQTAWASGPDKIAIRFDAVPRPIEMSACDYLKSGWVAGLDESSVQPIILHGLSGARARAANEKWQFDVTVILLNNHIFRFLTAAPHNSQNFKEVSEKTVRSFHFLSSSQLKKLKPLRIRIVRVKQGETVANLANQMHNTANKEQFFRILNALSPTQTLQRGSNVKIVTQ